MGTRRVTVIGGGLIGGSLCLALGRRRPDWEIVCLDLPGAVGSIAAAGVAHRVAPVDELPSHLPGSELVVLAVPVEAILALLEEIAPHLSPGTLITDVGSTKARIVERAREVLPAGVVFVGGHPIAGAERSGVAAADPLLFSERVFALCPAPETPPEALLTLIDLVEDLLAVPVTIEPEEHDRIMAMVSHVPQLLAVALVHAALEEDATHGLLDVVVGRGFLDLTRIAASEYAVWRSILETNRPAVDAALDRLESSLVELRAALGSGDLDELWGRVSERRRRMAPESAPRPRKPELRQLIDRCDERILKEVVTRQRVAERIGQLKASTDAPVYDPVRERQLRARRREWGEALGLTPELVEDLFAVIVDHSKRLQKRDR